MKEMRKSLIACIVSFTLCLGLLVGTSFAWFNDSITNKGNTITTGTLNLELNDGDTTPLFHSAAIWAPGKEQKATVKLENKGSLWLKYRVVATMTKVSGNADLSEALKVYAASADAESTEGATYLGTLADLKTGSTFDNDNVLAPAGEATAENPSVKTFTLFIVMPAATGDQYQDSSVEFDLAIEATQTTEGAEFASIWDGETTDTSWFEGGGYRL